MVAQNWSKKTFQQPRLSTDLAEADFVQSERGLWHLRVAEGDHLSERSEGGKLPQRKTRALATQRHLKAFLRGCFGGDARGAAKGA